MRRMLSLLSLLTLASLAHAAPETATAPATQSTWRQTDVGRLMLRPFESAPYPHASRANGYTNAAGQTFDAATHYSDSTVGIVVPAGYVPGDTVDYVVHFHGHRNHVSKVLDQYKLAEQLHRSGVNAILLVPQGPRDVPDSGDGKLELDENGFRNFIAEATRYLNEQKVIHTSKVSHIALSAHSGGYKVAASVLHRGGLTPSITDVFLLDATYGNLGWFVEYASSSPDVRIVSFHTKHLDDENAELKKLLNAAQIANREVQDKAFTADTIRQGGVTFVPTALSHDDVPAGNDHLANCLWTSKLDKRSPK